MSRELEQERRLRRRVRRLWIDGVMEWRSSYRSKHETIMPVMVLTNEVSPTQDFTLLTMSSCLPQ